MGTKHVNLRLSPEMHNRLVDAAERNHRSMNGQIEEYIERGLKADAPITPAQAADLLGRTKARLSDWDTPKTTQTKGEQQQ